MLWASFRGLGQALLKPLDHGDTVTKFGNALGWLFFLLSGGFLLEGDLALDLSFLSFSISSCKLFISSLYFNFVPIIHTKID